MLTPTSEKFQNVLQRAQRLYDQDPDWVTFFRELLGVDGIVRQTFPSLDELTSFEKSSEYEQIQQWIVKLREKRSATDTESEPTRVITVRLPRSMHEYLKTEAHDLRTSMNKLCISKLLQVIEQDKIPAERTSGTPRRQTTPAAPSTNHAPPTLASSSLAPPSLGSSSLGSSSLGSSSLGSSSLHAAQPAHSTTY